MSTWGSKLSWTCFLVGISISLGVQATENIRVFLQKEGRDGASLVYGCVAGNQTGPCVDSQSLCTSQGGQFIGYCFFEQKYTGVCCVGLDPATAQLTSSSPHHFPPANDNPSILDNLPIMTVPTITTPTTNLPSITTPTTNLPSITTPNIGLPSITTPTINLPSITPPTVDLPSITPPTINLPSITPPTIDLPSITPPTINLPSITPPTIDLPSITTPTINLPSITPPTIDLPSITTPTINLPSITPPTIDLPSITTPTIDLPSITTPTINLPDVTLPSVTLPNITMVTPPTLPNITLPSETVTMPNITMPSMATVTLPSVTFPSMPTVTFPTMETVTFPNTTFPSMATVTLPNVTFPSMATVTLPNVTFPSMATVTLPSVTFPSMPTVTFPTMETVTFPNTTFPSMATVTLPSVTFPSMPNVTIPSMPTVTMPSMATMPNFTLPTRPSFPSWPGFPIANDPPFAEDTTIDPSCSVISQDVQSQFHNPSYPSLDTKPNVYQYTVVPQAGYCALRVTFIDALFAGRQEESCSTDSVVIINSGDSQSVPQCGLLQGYRFTVRTISDEPVRVVITTQSSAYLWNMNVTQIKCSSIRPYQDYESQRNCGIKNLKPPTPSGIVIPPQTVKIVPASKLLKSKKKSFSDITVNPPAPTKLLSSVALSRKTEIKIVRGNETGINEWPWQVLLMINGRPLCGGTLLNDEWILTASHCVEFSLRYPLTSVLTVDLGDHDLKTTTETKNIVVRVSQIVPNVKYEAAHNDIALIRLATKIPYSKTVRPVCLPYPRNPVSTYAGETAITLGWGRTENSVISPVLREASLKVISNEECRQDWAAVGEGGGNLIDNGMLCAGTEDVGPCNADSGGPILLQEYNKWRLIGITSFGSLRGCALPGIPTVYTRVTSFQDWIALNLAEE